jgi:hypothetical protein
MHKPVLDVHALLYRIEESCRLLVRGDNVPRRFSERREHL